MKEKIKKVEDFRDEWVKSETIKNELINISSVDGKVVVVSPDDFGATGGDTAGSWADF